MADTAAQATVDEFMSETAVPVVAVNEEGLIEHVNEEFERLFGWTRQEALSQPLSIIIPAGLVDAHNMGFSRFLASGKPTILNTPLTLRAVARDGSEFDAEHVIAGEQRDGAWVFAATIRPLPAPDATA